MNAGLQGPPDIGVLSSEASHAGSGCTVSTLPALPVCGRPRPTHRDPAATTGQEQHPPCEWGRAHGVINRVTHGELSSQSSATAVLGKLRAHTAELKSLPTAPVKVTHSEIGPLQMQ